MGNCVGSKKLKNPPTRNSQILKLQKMYNEKQLRLLKLLYSDISSRTADGEVSMQNFLLFFHKNGYWGERLFKQFDTGHSNTITQEQFIKGIVKIFKTTEEKKIELLFKFFSDSSDGNGISFSNFLKMLYNYPKEDLNKILDDPDFINKELKKNLVGVDNELAGRRLVSLSPTDVKNNAVNGKAFRLEQSDCNSDKMQSKYGAKIIYELNKQNSEKKSTVRIKIGENNVQIKTTSIHQLVKKYGRSIFKNYGINQNTGRFNYQDFKDWIIHHKNLYNDFYKGFHSEVWEVDKVTNKPVYTILEMEYSTKGRAYLESKILKVVISLFQSILIVCQQSNNQMPILLVCLEGLAANPIFDNDKGHGIELSHRDGIYQKKIFYLQNQQLQKNWMQFLKFYKGSSINQIYQIKQQIGTGKFSVVYNCIQKNTGQHFAIKVIQSYKLDDEARKIIAHESSIMSVMSHPLLVFFKESIATKTHIYIVTELVKGKDLFDFVRQHKYLGEMESAYILEQIIIGVRYIHSLGIVHRDLKPENIMLQYDERNNTIGRIKIIDFGFANYISNLREMSRECNEFDDIELWAGTPNYIAPEILREDHFSEKIDNFAIGSILYFMLSGNLPFNSIDVSIIMQKTLDGSFPLNDKRWKQVSQDARDLVLKLLQNDPINRISLDNALNHPWLAKHRDERPDSTILKIHWQKPNKLNKQSPTTTNGTAIIY